jgi:hypothetical protein
MSELKNENRKRKSNAAKVEFTSENNKSVGKKHKPKQTVNNKNNDHHHQGNFQQIDEMIEKFEDLFLNEEKITNKRVREFTKEAFSIHKENIAGESIYLNYNNLIVFLLKFCGLEVENNPNYRRLLSSLDEDNCADFDLLDELIANSKVKNEKFKTSKVYTIFESIVAEIYNNYEITNSVDFEILKKFILNFLKLTQNKYRKIRYYSSLILINIFKLILEELINTKKLLSQRSKSKNNAKNLDSFVQTKNNSKSLDESANSILEAKIKILSELSTILKEKFLFKKISDVSKNIRLVICDYIVKISKNHFNELFSDEKLVKLYPQFLLDRNTSIKSKYLQLVYEKLDLVEEEQSGMDVEEINEDNSQSTIKTIIKILSVARDAILNICVKEEKVIAKQAIKIIELLSQHNILEIKTVQSLLPHLFNPEVQIRNLISKVVINYILNFEKIVEEENQELDEEITQSSKKKKSKSHEDNNNNNQNLPQVTLTIEHLMQMLEFFLKLSENDEKLVKVLVDNFHKHLNIFNKFNLFFEMIEILLNNNSTSQETIENTQNILQTLLLVLNYSVEKTQIEIESQLNEESVKLPMQKNEDFINGFICNISSFLKKIRINLSTPVACENFVYLLKLFERFKIFPQNIIKFSADDLIQVAVELKNSFFINMNTMCFDQDSEDFYESLIDSILKGLHRILSLSNKNEFSNLKSAQLESVVYSDSSSSLARDFCEIIYKQILSTSFYKTLSNIKSDEFHLDNTVNSSISQNDLMLTLHILLTQFNYLLHYFRDIFITSDVEEDNLLNLYTFSNFIENLIRFLHKFLNKKDEASILLFYKVVNASLNLLDTIHMINLNEVLIKVDRNSQNEWIERYVSHRNNIIITLSIVMNREGEFNFIHENCSDVSLTYNTCLLKLKTKALNIFLEMMIYVSSDKIEKESLKFNLEENMVEMVEDFLKENFIKFYYEYNQFMEEKRLAGTTQGVNDEENNKLNDNTQVTVMFNKSSSLFHDELATKTYLFKSICEKFSRLLLLNLSIFRYTNFCSIYFSAFYLLKLPAVIDNLNTFVYESLLEKEVVHYLKTNNNISNLNTTSPSLSSLNVIIFYLTKITMLTFSNKIRLFQLEKEIPLDERIEMISRLVNMYLKAYKKMKTKLNKEGIDVITKDKPFYENFLVNSINFAMESKKEVVKIIEPENEDEQQKTIASIQVENIKFFEIIKFYFKSNIFLNDSDLKNILMIFLKLSKPVEMLENVYRPHIRLIEKFKNFLLTKAKVFISSTNEDEAKTGNRIDFDQYEEDKDEDEPKAVVNKKDENNFESDEEEDEAEFVPPKRNKSKTKKINQGSKREQKSGKKRKFREVEAMNEMKDPDENNRNKKVKRK